MPAFNPDKEAELLFLEPPAFHFPDEDGLYSSWYDTAPETAVQLNEAPPEVMFETFRLLAEGQIVLNES